MAQPVPEDQPSPSSVLSIKSTDEGLYIVAIDGQPLDPPVFMGD